MDKKQMIQSAAVGQEITWLCAGWTSYTGIVTAIIERNKYTGFNEQIAVQVENSCMVIDTCGFIQQVVIGGTVEKILGHNRALNALEREAQNSVG